MTTMATIFCCSLATGEKMSVSKAHIIPLLSQSEKHAFARTEVLDFEDELKKRNVVLNLVIDTSTADINTHHLAGYMLLAFQKPGRAAHLHKICVHPVHRKRGLATRMLREAIEKLNHQGCARLQLWVDQSNAGACSLYEKAGFEQLSKVKDYYGFGRTGLQMVLYLV